MEVFKLVAELVIHCNSLEIMFRFDLQLGVNKLGTIRREAKSQSWSYTEVLDCPKVRLVLYSASK